MSDPMREGMRQTNNAYNPALEQSYIRYAGGPERIAPQPQPRANVYNPLEQYARGPQLPWNRQKRVMPGGSVFGYGGQRMTPEQIYNDPYGFYPTAPQQPFALPDPTPPSSLRSDTGWLPQRGPWKPDPLRGAPPVQPRTNVYNPFEQYSPQRRMTNVYNPFDDYRNWLGGGGN